jgi:glutamate dehydrogenase (NADP+)
MDRKEAKAMAKGNPYSFLHIIRSEIDYPSSLDQYDPKVYRKARKNLRVFEEDGILVQDDKPMIYIYRQIMDGREQTGFVGATSIDDYENNVIKKHELTLLRKERDRVDHFDACDANTAPIFLTYRDEDRLNEILVSETKKAPEYEFTTEDGVSHIVWSVTDEKLIAEITERFATIESLYIADGHHRAASAAKVAQKRRQEFPNYTGEEEFNYFMSVIFPVSNLEVMPYNRVVHDLGGITLEYFWQEMHKLFDITETEANAPYKPIEPRTFGMYVNKVWYKLVLKKDCCIGDQIVDNIDAAILEKYMLNDILGIKNSRESSRISFVGGIRGLKGLKDKTDELDGCGIAMFPVSMKSVMEVADEGLIMPAKSTWFEPKLRSGLFVHKLESHITPSIEGETSQETKEYIEKVLEVVKHRDGNQSEFIQAVTEVLHSLGPVLEKHPEYIEHNILERIVEPERAIQFRVPWVDDEGNTQVNRGFRVQFNGAIGPYKGGLRFHPSVYLGLIKFLGFEQIFKNSLTGLPIGGGKGGSDFNPLGKSDEEIRRFAVSFMTELYRHIGPDVDVPAGDIGVGGREIGYLYGQYRRIRGAFENGVLTGKGLNYGGSLIRPEATGYGATYFALSMLRHDETDFQNKTVAVSGFGNVAWGVCKKVRDLGGKVVTLSGPEGYVYDPDGVITQEKIDFMLEMRANTNGKIKDYADRFGCEFFPGKKPWERKVDVVMPCATQNEIHPADAEMIIKNGVKYIVEGANMPTTNEAVAILQAAGVVIGPGKAANAGGVATSALEMAQNSMRIHWTAEEVDEKLRGIMKNIYNSCVRASSLYGFGYDLIAGANIAGFTKVADAMIQQGKY